MDTEALKKELASLESQRGKLVAAITQLDGAINFCKGLIGKSEKPVEPAALDKQIAEACGGEG